jgi:hypothetical protein
MTVVLPLVINVDCNGACSNCEWKQKPSTCAPWDDWRVENKINNKMFLELVDTADKYFGVENLIVEE